jgi:hypothetical protein
MKSYGHLNMLQNQLQNAALQTLTSFPTTPVVGQLAFVNSIVFICVTAGSLPVWVPLTREITAYTHTQEAASVLWNVTHSLNTTSVNVQVFDGNNKVVLPSEVTTTGPNTLTIDFGSTQAGRAVVVTGHFDGNVKPTYAYTHYQSVADTSWSITHNLGYNPIIRVFIGTNEVQPSTIVHNSTNQVTVTFSTPQVGYVRMI